MRYTIFETDLGWMGALASGRGLRRITIPLSSPDEVIRDLECDLADAELDPDSFGDLPDRVRSLFKGGRVSFPDTLDLQHVTPFKRAVWEAVRTIPRGETRSYGWIAAQVGRPAGARAVGQAMASNPIAIMIPCHRVIAGDGGLGGYGVGHIDTKKRLLQAEGANTPGRK